MKKLEFEKILMDSGELKKLTERVNNIKKMYDEPLETEGTLQVVLPLDQEIRPTPEEIQANNFNYVERKNLLANIDIFLPELEAENPAKCLSIFTDKCRKDPSETNQFLVEDAINRLTSIGELDAENEKLVAESIKTLTSANDPKAKKGKVTDSIWARFYQHSDYRGRSLFINCGPGVIYRLLRASSLKSAKLHDNISSLYVDASISEISGDVILFQDDRYQGRYVLFTTTLGAPSVRNWINYVGSYINDKTSSIMIVRHFENEMSPIRLGDFELKDEIEGIVRSMSRISLRGEPIITWDMWPEGPTSGSDPHPNDPRKFIYIKIPVEVEVPNWFNYDADIRYWIYPYVDSNGTLRAYVAYYGAWVEGGVISGSILNTIMNSLPGTIGTINARLNDVLKMANIFRPFSLLYFLPGTASSTGHTNDDVSIVLVRR